MKIVGLCLCAGGEADNYLEKTLCSLEKVCDTILVALNNGTEKERELLRKHNCVFYDDNRVWGEHQRLMKSTLHAYANERFKPDWFLCMDADEELDAGFGREIFEKLTGDAYHSYLIDLWGDETRYRPDMCFWRVQIYRNRPDLGYAFSQMGFDPALVPEWAASSAGYIPHFVKHYGLITKEARAKRIKRYETYDKEQTKLPVDYYRALHMDSNGEILKEEELTRQLKDEVSAIPPKKKTIKETMPNFVWVRRTFDGVVLDIPEDHLAEHLKRRRSTSTGQVQEFELYNPSTETQGRPTPATVSDEIISPPDVVADPLECQVCGFVAKTETGLKVHDKKHQ